MENCLNKGVSRTEQVEIFFVLPLEVKEKPVAQDRGGLTLGSMCECAPDFRSDSDRMDPWMLPVWGDQP